VSGGPSCRCSERFAPLTIDLPSNDRLRQWRVVQRRCNHSAFNGYHKTWSDYSSVTCLVCDAVWRTKASYIDLIDDIDDDWARKSLGGVPSRESLGLPAQKGT
jgi:hypothetical protein